MLYCLKLYWKHWNANCKHVTQKILDQDWLLWVMYGTFCIHIFVRKILMDFCWDHLQISFEILIDKSQFQYGFESKFFYFPFLK